MVTNRKFEDNVARKEQTPVLVGLVSPSGAGKTFSALRLATGMQRVTGGEIFVIDTEQKRSLHYASKFNFRHVPFVKPFGPLDYLSAIGHCVDRGAKVIVIDSMSHEHEGPGGILEMHSQELDRMAGDDRTKRARMQLPAWATPKRQHRRLVDAIVQTDCHFVICYRAKRKIKIVTGKEPVDLGWMPIASTDMIFEMTLNLFLHPGANGVPTMNPIEPGERDMIKVPEQFRDLFPVKSPVLDESIGERFARWASDGERPKMRSISDVIADIHACSDADVESQLKIESRKMYPAMSKGDKEAISAAFKESGERIQAALDAARRATDRDDEETLTLAEPSEEEKREIEQAEARGGY